DCGVTLVEAGVLQRGEVRLVAATGGIVQFGIRDGVRPGVSRLQAYPTADTRAERGLQSVIGGPSVAAEDVDGSKRRSSAVCIDAGLSGGTGCAAAERCLNAALRQ